MDFNTVAVPQCQNFEQHNLQKYNSNNKNNNNDNGNQSQKLSIMGKKVRNQHQLILCNIALSVVLTMILLQMPTGGSAAALSLENEIRRIIMYDELSSSSFSSSELCSSSEEEEEEQDVINEKYVIDLLKNIKKDTTIIKRTGYIDSEWRNTCGGNLMVTEVVHYPEEVKKLNDENKTKIYDYILKLEILPKLRKTIKHKLSEIGENCTIDITAANIKKVKELKMPAKYNFLPTFTESDEMDDLMKLHSDMQTFVGTFQHLKNKEEHRYKNYRDANRTYFELKKLLFNAKQVLCEIESALNKSMVYGDELVNNSMSIEFITPHDMAIMLQNMGPKQYIKKDSTVTKHFYYTYLQSLMKKLMAGTTNSAEYNFSDSSDGNINFCLDECDKEYTAYDNFDRSHCNLSKI